MMNDTYFEPQAADIPFVPGGGRKGCAADEAEDR